MTAVVVALSVAATSLPVGVAFAHLQISVVDGSGAKQSANIDGSATISATFDNVAPGDGIATAVAIDSTGAELGPAISTSFTVPQPQSTFPQPATITVTIQ